MNKVPKAHVRSFVLSCCLLLWSITGTHAQRCGNGAGTPDSLFHALLQRKMEQRASGTISYIPLQFHLISCSGQEQNWYAGDTTQVQAAIDSVNVQFKAADIQFCKAGKIDRIVNDTFCIENYNTIFFRYQNVYRDTGVIHVYIPVRFANSNFVIGNSFGFASSSGTNPLGYGMSGSAVMIESACLPNDKGGKKNVLTHELGHFFGLLHCNNYSYITGYELANGSNGSTTGDFCGDTPAEYGNFFVDSNCNLIRSLLTDVDANGDTLHPDPANIMSSNIWSPKCARYFTPNQISRIKYFHNTYLNYLHCKSTSGVTTEADQTAEVSLAPNPAGTFQKILLHLPKPVRIQIELFDARGHKVATVLEMQEMSGISASTVDCSSFPSGFYYYHVNINGVSWYLKTIKL